jgi:hypothetical protein
VDPAQLRDILAALKDAGVRAAKVPVGSDISDQVLEVEFDRSLPTGAATALRDARTGEPVNLDEGAPETARDLDAEIAAKNFQRPEAK